MTKTRRLRLSVPLSCQDAGHAKLQAVKNRHLLVIGHFSQKGSLMTILPRSRLFRLLAALGIFTALWVATLPAQELDPRLKEVEEKRVAVIDKVRPSVVAIFGRGGQGGGSGVLIDADGYALTNFHVTAGSGNVMKCGLPDGVLYDGVLVGLDKVGDVALIKLF